MYSPHWFHSSSKTSCPPGILITQRGEEVMHTIVFLFLGAAGLFPVTFHQTGTCFHMKKYLLIALLITGIDKGMHAQPNPAATDSLKIDSLRKMLPVLKGIRRVICMIRLVEYFYDGAPVAGSNPRDSVPYYGKLILDESRKINYRKGMAIGLMAAPTQSESIRASNVREALKIGEQTGDEEIMGWACQLLARAELTPDEREMERYAAASLDHFHKSGNILREVAEGNWVADGFREVGQYEKTFDLQKRLLDLLKSDSSLEFAWGHLQAKIWGNWDLSELYSVIGDYETALTYMRICNELDKDGFLLDISGIFYNMGKYDSALIYWTRMRNGPDWNNPQHWKPGKLLAMGGLASIYIATKRYDSAFKILNPNLIYFDSLSKYATANWKHVGGYGKMTCSESLAKAYSEQGLFKTALAYARQAIDFAIKDSRIVNVMGTYLQLSTIFHGLGNNDSAYDYLVKYHAIKDSIENKQAILRLYNAKKDAETQKKQDQILLLDKDNKLKSQQLKENAQQRNILLILVAALFLTGALLYRSIALKRKNERLKLENQLAILKLESEKKQAELKRQATELQLQALRVQMNPHFIFNSLSSINWFIMENDREMASDYLTRFSKLMRMVLNAQKPMIPLEDELKMLELYIDLERLRFNHVFDYSLTFTNAVDSGTISIPPMLLQPFCENAIWHGLMNKEGKGHLAINICSEENTLKCTITDDGVGRRQAAIFKSKSLRRERSMGLEITRERLALFSQEHQAEAGFRIEDIEDENGTGKGTRVILTIAYKADIEKVA